jgi:hypothetical protein
MQHYTSEEFFKLIVSVRPNAALSCFRCPDINHKTFVIWILDEFTNKNPCVSAIRQINYAIVI